MATVAVPEPSSVTRTFYRVHVLTAEVNYYIIKNLRKHRIKLLNKYAHAHWSALEVLLHPLIVLASLLMTFG